MILERVWQALRKERLLVRGDGVLIGCSGGADSTALLDILVRFRARLDLRLRAVYVHHGLRVEADAEAQRVLGLAAVLGVDAETVRVRVPRQASRQAAARTVRLAALERLAAARRLRRIALGHTRTDQAETVLMRVLRGTGPRGLAAIPPVRGAFIRPLLCVGRNEIEAYLRERSLDWVDDASNLDRRYLRVRTRLDLMPVLRTVNPRVEEALARLAENARQERGGAISLPLQRAHLQALAEMLDAPGGTRLLSLPGGRTAEVRVVSGIGFPTSAKVAIHIPGPGRYAIPALGTTVVLERARNAGHRPGACFAAAALSFPLVLRTRRPGDRIRLEAGSKKISDLLIDAKVPRRERDRVLLLCAGRRVLWVAGLRQAAGTRPHDGAGFLADVDPAPMQANNGGARCDPP